MNINDKENEKNLSCKSNRNQTVRQERLAFEYLVFSMVGWWNSEFLTKVCEIRNSERKSVGNCSIVYYLESSVIFCVLYSTKYSDVK